MANPVTTLPPASRSVVVAGASGLVGRCLVEQLCADPSVSVVHALVRRPLTETHPKLQVHVVDFTALPALPPVDEVYLSLGTTIKIAGSQAAFRAIDHDAVLAVAQAAQQAGAARVGVVSAMGADAQSRLFYNRVKGETEADLAQLGLPCLVIARPSLLLGDRSALNQPGRRGESLGAAVSALLRPFMPANYRAIRAEDVAAALWRSVKQGVPGRTVLLSGQMQPH